MNVNHEKFKCNVNIINHKSALAQSEVKEVIKHAIVGSLQSSLFSKIHFSSLF